MDDNSTLQLGRFGLEKSGVVFSFTSIIVDAEDDLTANDHVRALGRLIGRREDDWRTFFPGGSENTRSRKNTSNGA